jgi:hypothetical protein
MYGLYLVVYRQRGRPPIVRLREEVVAEPDTYLRSNSDLWAADGSDRASAASLNCLVAEMWRSSAARVGRGRQRHFRPRNFLQTVVDLQPKASTYANHFVGARRRSAYSEDCVALLQQAHRDRMEDFVKSLVANVLDPARATSGSASHSPRSGMCPARKMGNA